MTILGSIKTYIEGYAGLEEDAPVWTNYLGPAPVQYSINPLGSDKIMEQYLDGSSLRVYNFAFNSVEYTIEELDRVGADEFYEEFGEWLEAQSEAGNLPVLGPGKSAIEISATGWGYLFEQNESGTGIYQVQCRLIYEQRPVE